jgi:predicted ATPase
VIGREFRLPLLERAAAVSTDAVLEALDEAVAARLVEQGQDGAGRYRFTHMLVRETLYDELSATRRGRLHQRVVKARGARPRTPGRASSWPTTGRGDQGSGRRQGDRLRQAGERALANLAFEEAAAHFERALGVLEPQDPDGERLR